MRPKNILESHTYMHAYLFNLIKLKKLNKYFCFFFFLHWEPFGTNDLKWDLFNSILFNFLTISILDLKHAYYPKLPEVSMSCHLIQSTVWITADLIACDSSGEVASTGRKYLSLFYVRGAQIFSTISTAFLNPSHGETQSAAYTAFLGELGGFLWGLATLPRRRRRAARARPSAITAGGSFGGSGKKDDIALSVVMRCHRTYWFLDRLASGVVATADCVCCLFSPLAFLPWCNWHRVYRSGNYCNTWDSSGQWGRTAGVSVWAHACRGGGDVAESRKSFAIDGAQLCFSHGSLIRWRVHTPSAG